MRVDLVSVIVDILLMMVFVWFLLFNIVLTRDAFATTLLINASFAPRAFWVAPSQKYVEGPTCLEVPSADVLFVIENGELTKSKHDSAFRL